MPHMVKCFYCNKIFDRDKIPAIKVTAKRYAHESCSVKNVPDEKTKEQIDKDNFYQLIKSIYGPNYNYMLINTQAEEYILKYGYTWSGMTKCLNWFYIINHGSLEEGHGGIGIIPYIWNDVYKYYYDFFKAQEKNKKIELRHPVIEFNIQSPKSYQQSPQLLDLEEEENETG